MGEDKATEIWEAFVDVALSKVPVFRDRSKLTEEQLTDPDYALKELEKKVNKGRYKVIGCSRCHHCR